MNSEFIENFKKLKFACERALFSQEEKRKQDLAVIDFLQAALRSNELEGTDEIGFAYWNISDSFALLRDSNNLYKNHCEFADFLKDKPSKYLFWPVSDATQRFTLELGGFADFWWDCYKNALSKNVGMSGIGAITFECHNAALSVTPAVKTPVGYLELAKNNFRSFLEANESSDNYIFYETLYYALCLKAFGSAERDVFDLGMRLFPWLKSEKSQNDFLIGEWKMLNGQKSKYDMARVAINRAINALIDTESGEPARELYGEARAYGLSKNAYIEKRILS
ncbi:unknown [Eubacterium sp. CAG:841]|nr:unknown [Eubacterium sp. CAG:841]